MRAKRNTLKRQIMCPTQYSAHHTPLGIELTSATLTRRFSALDMLKATRERLATPGVWAQGGWDGDATTVQSDNWNKDGCTCLFLGLDSEADRIFGDDFDWLAPDADAIYDEYVQTAKRAQELLLAEIGVTEVGQGYRWNDDKSRTLQDVLDVLDLAIAVASQED